MYYLIIFSNDFQFHFTFHIRINHLFFGSIQFLFQLRDAQWDIRITLPSPDEDVPKLLQHLDHLWETNNIMYLTCSGVESSNDHPPHVHLFVVLRNATSNGLASDWLRMSGSQRSCNLIGSEMTGRWQLQK